MAVALDFVPRLAKKAKLRFDRHSGGYMIIYPERGLSLNESAAEIVKRFDGTRTVANIVEELTAEHGDAAIVTDVVALVETLVRKGLLEP
jgi:pyrroloquinoline quinone biosynthesis protein D